MSDDDRLELILLRTILAHETPLVSVFRERCRAAGIAPTDDQVRAVHERIDDMLRNYVENFGREAARGAEGRTAR
jgi:hypothetical protein